MWRVTTAAEIARSLGGRKDGAGFIARCPAHKDQTPSLSIKDGHDGTTLTHCFAGCTPAAVWSALKDAGLVAGATETLPVTPVVDESADQKRRIDYARQIWSETVDAKATATERYLEHRLIRLRPDDIRHHVNLKHRGTGQFFPAMVAAIRDRAGEFTGVQRTFLKLDGRGKAGISTPKMSFGKIKGGAVRLTPPAATLWITEGVEDGLSVVQMFGRACWAVCGASNAPNLELPAMVRTIILALDGNKAGRSGTLAAIGRFEAGGRAVFVAEVPGSGDWNDQLGDIEERRAICTIDGAISENSANIISIEEFKGRHDQNRE